MSSDSGSKVRISVPAFGLILTRGGGRPEAATGVTPLGSGRISRGTEHSRQIHVFKAPSILRWIEQRNSPTRELDGLEPIQSGVDRLPRLYHIFVSRPTQLIDVIASSLANKTSRTTSRLDQKRRSASLQGDRSASLTEGARSKGES